MSALVIRGRRVVLPEGLGPAALHIEDGRIARVTPYDALEGAEAVIEAGDHVVSAGLVDAHVHMNQPGRTAWEGAASATAAAAAGGITTVVDMPLNCIPATTTRAALEAKRASLEGQLHVDVALWAGVVPGNLGELAGMAAAGVAGAKCFLCPSGVDEFSHVTRADLELALPLLRELRLPLLAHAEMPGALDRAAAAVRASGADPRAYTTWLAARPAAAEDEAIAMLIELCRVHRAPVHVVHVASARGVELVAAAQREGLPLSAEACLHYLTFCAAEVPEGATHFKCAPPIRDAANRERLWQGLAAGTLSMVTSDHSPCPPELKCAASGDFLKAWGGIAGLQLGLSGLWSEAHARGVALETMLGWVTEAPARLAGLGGRKGRLEAGHDADVVIWDDAATWTVEPSELRHRHALTPYAGRRMRGVVHQSWVRGRRVFSRTEGLATPPAGSFVLARR